MALPGIAPVPVSLAVPPGQLPSVAGWILATPERARRHVSAGGRGHPPATPGGRLCLRRAIAPMARGALGRRAGWLRLSRPGGGPLEYRQHCVQPFAPDEPRRAVID